MNYTETKVPELVNCPMCGSQAEYTNNLMRWPFGLQMVEGKIIGGVWVYCGRCGLTLGMRKNREGEISGEFENLQAAAGNWNRRSLAI